MALEAADGGREDERLALQRGRLARRDVQDFREARRLDFGERIDRAADGDNPRLAEDEDRNEEQRGDDAERDAAALEPLFIAHPLEIEMLPLRHAGFDVSGLEGIAVDVLCELE